MDSENIEWQTFKTLIDYYGIDMDTPFKDFTEDQVDIIMHGSREPIKYEITTVGGFTMRKNAYIEGLADLIESK